MASLYVPELIQRFVSSAQNACKRATNVGVYWKWADMDAHRLAIGFDELTCPLRLDIVIRHDFLNFYQQHKDLYLRNKTAFLKMAKDHDYFKWYFHVKLPRLKTVDLGDHQSVVAAFNKRVESFLSLYGTIRDHGYETNSPITIKTATCVLASESGKIVSNRFFAGNGCHRIAILMYLGHRHLSPDYYRIQQFNRLIPHDNTARLYKHLNLSQEQYATFLGKRYGAGNQYGSIEELSKYVTKNKPEVLAEFESVLKGDLRGI